MIITEQKPLKEILQMVEPYKKLMIVGCGGCATFYGTGSRIEEGKMVKLLEKYGKKIVASLIVPRMCDVDMVRARVPNNLGDA
ncbi:MAG: hypothetical protein QME59_03725, partial [Candidatus Hydrothermarchaeota archaeon]|nr:hypothetical protein [Candidatus Hydrothermarchaeota archaeon]